MSEELGLTVKKAEDFGKWYLEVIKKSDIVDERVPIKGCNVLLPTGWWLWKNIMDKLDDILMQIGCQNYYFPLFIPERFLKKEAEHFKGFVPEVAWVTMAGKVKLAERMAIRPTSEIIMYEMLKTWIRAYTDLPLKINQYCNIVRWDTKMTKPLIRDREFLWHETHCTLATEKEAQDEVKIALNIYRELVSEILGLEYIELVRPDWDKFPGAEYSVALEGVLPDGKILQFGTVHYLGQKFTKALGIKFLDKDGKKNYPYQLSYGVTTRLLGALVAVHGDDHGLIIPPAIAPLQVVIIPIYTGITKTKVLQKAGEILGRLEGAGYKAHLDDREQYTPGFKFHEWELKGVPIRIEIGPKDIENRQVTFVRRDFLERTAIPESNIEQQMVELADSIYFQLHKRALESLKIQDVSDYKELKEKLLEGGFVRANFCMTQACAEKLKESTGADVRGTLFGKEEKPKGKCAVCGKEAKARVYIARTY